MSVPDPSHQVSYTAQSVAGSGGIFAGRCGSLPWSPRDSVSDLDVWQEYEVPLAGTFVLDGTVVLFTAVGDVGARLSVWAYTFLTPDEAAEAAITQFDSVEDLQCFVEGLFKHRQSVFALADELLIERWSPLEVGDQLLDAATRFLTDVLKVVERDTDAKARFRAKLASVDAATSDLVDVQA